MLKQLTHVNLWVHDQDEALAFYTDKLGMELRADVTMAEMGNYRFLTVGPAGQPDVQLVLAVPGPPVFDPADVDTVNDLVAKGSMSGVMFVTDDCRATSAELKRRGVEFSEEPNEQPFGTVAAVRDPSGNQIRMVQPR